MFTPLDEFAQQPGRYLQLAWQEGTPLRIVLPNNLRIRVETVADLERVYFELVDSLLHQRSPPQHTVAPP